MSQYATNPQNLIQTQNKNIFSPEANPSTTNYRIAARTGKLRLDKILQLNLQVVISNNDLSPLEELLTNLTMANVDEDNDFDPSTSKLLKIFQYSLEYLYNKQLDLVSTNKTLENDYSQLINDSYAIEERLKANKLFLSKQDKEKKEKEMLLISYKAIIDYHCRPKDDSNKELKELLGNPNAKYYCHICSGKPFSTGAKLESHMKRRHINQYSKEANVDESFENYGNQIEEMRRYFEAKLKEKEDEQMRQIYFNNLDKMRNENERKRKEMEERLRDTLFEFKEFILKNAKNQPQTPVIIQQPKDDKDNLEILKMKQSLVDINSFIKAEYDRKMEQIMKELNDLKNRPIPKNTETQIIREISQKPILSTQKEQIFEISHSYRKKDQDESVKEIIPVPNASSKGSIIIVEKEESIKESYYPPMKEESIKPSINVSEVVTNKSIQMIPKKRVSQEFEFEKLPQPPKVNLNKTVVPQGPKKQFKPINLVRDFNKTMSVTDELEEFYTNFMNRDNVLLEKTEDIHPDDYLHKIVPNDVVQKEEDLNKTIKKNLIETARKDNFIYETFEDKNKKELLQIIEQTLQNIENVNHDQDIAELYFNSVQKAIDFKIYETDKDEMKANMNVNKSIISKNSFNSRISKRSRAADVIKKANEDIEIV